MSLRRFNELRAEQVVYAVQRQDRTFLPAEDHCPLCPTRPGQPPTEIPFPSYEIVVFDNLFPAFEAPAGAAEVVVYTDEHHGSFAALAPERAEALMWVWRQRYEELGGTVRWHGKPFGSVYRTCFELLGGMEKRRILAVGDSLRTDIAGAKAAGCSDKAFGTAS